jgi:competence protein ComEC
LAWPAGLADLARRIAQRIREWVAVEVGPGRLVPWLAITYGCGIAVYFAATASPHRGRRAFCSRSRQP